MKTFKEVYNEAAAQYSKKGSKKFHVKVDSGSWDSYLIDGLRLKINDDIVRLVTSSGVPNNLGNIGFNMKPAGSDASIRKLILDINKKNKGDMKKFAKDLSSIVKLKVEVLGTVSEEVVSEAAGMTDAQLATLKKEYGKIDKINPSSPAYKKMKKKLESLPDNVLQQIKDAEIKFLRWDADTILKGRKKK